jgi:hypothetical protein
LETVVIRCPKNDIMILLGNLNAKVWFKDQDRSFVGNCGLHEESNDNGLRLTGLASALNMVTGSTTFPHKKTHLATWRPPDGTTNNQTDHILTDARHKNNMMVARTYGSANADSDHYFLITRRRQKLGQNIFRTNRKQ